MSMNDPVNNNQNAIGKHYMKTILPFLKEKSPISFDDYNLLKRHEKIFGIVPDIKSDKYITNRIHNLNVKITSSVPIQGMDNEIKVLK